MAKNFSSDPFPFFLPWFNKDTYQEGLGPVPNGQSRHATHAEVVSGLKEAGFTLVEKAPKPGIMAAVTMVLQVLAQNYPFVTVLTDSVVLKEALKEIILQTWAFTYESKVCQATHEEIFQLAKQVAANQYPTENQEAMINQLKFRSMLAWDGLTSMNRMFSRYAYFAESILDSYLKRDRKILFLGTFMGQDAANTTALESQLEEVVVQSLSPGFWGTFRDHTLILPIKTKSAQTTTKMAEVEL